MIDKFDLTTYAPMHYDNKTGAVAAPVEQASAEQSNSDIDAAEELAAFYDGDDRQDIKTDVMNSFYAGIRYCRKSIPPQQAPNRQAVLGAFAIDVEKLLCSALGREWSASGISVETLIGDLAARSARPAWISVDDTRKPEPRTPVLLFVRTCMYRENEAGNQEAHEGSEIAMGEWLCYKQPENDRFDCYTSPMSDNDYITHWMPLPAAPSDQTSSASEDADKQSPAAVVIPPQQAPEPQQIEAAAKAIYRLFDGAEFHLWRDGGNSNKQDDARRYARAALELASPSPAPESVRDAALDEAKRAVISVSIAYENTTSEAVRAIEALKHIAQEKEQ